MRVSVLLYESENDGEGIHSLEVNGKTIVLMFENPDDAERYCGLLEAQDFPTPTIEQIDQEEIESFCLEAGYEPRLVESGFVPKNDEDRLLIAPPQTNLDVDKWQEDNPNDSIIDETNIEKNQNKSKLDHIRQRLEDLL